MTSLQKAIINNLLEGATIANCRSSGYRLRTQEGSVISKFYTPTFYSLKKYLRKEKSGLFVINKNEVRQLHGKSWIKREYKKHLKQNLCK